MTEAAAAYPRAKNLRASPDEQMRVSGRAVSMSK